MYKRQREMQSELFQTEQYVQMALQYLRMEKMTSDLVFARYDSVSYTHLDVYKRQV